MWFLTSNATALYGNYRHTSHPPPQTYTRIFTYCDYYIRWNFKGNWAPFAMLPSFSALWLGEEKKDFKSSRKSFYWKHFLFSNHCAIFKPCPGWKKLRWAMSKTSRAYSFSVRRKYQQLGNETRYYVWHFSVNQKSVTAVYMPDAPPSVFCTITKCFFRSPSRFTGTSLKLPCYDVSVDGGNLECADCFGFDDRSMLSVLKSYH